MAASIVAAFAVLVVLSGLKGPSSRLEGVLDDFRHWTWMVVRGPTENGLFPEICGRIEGVCFAPGLT
jgi:hypothetical protein